MVLDADVAGKRPRLAVRRHIEGDHIVFVLPQLHDAMVLSALAPRRVHRDDRAVGVMRAVVGLVIGLDAVYNDIRTGNCHVPCPPQFVITLAIRRITCATTD